MPISCDWTNRKSLLEFVSPTAVANVRIFPLLSMTRSDFHIPRQRCNDFNAILPSLHGNVAFLIYNVDKRIIFAAELLKERTKV